MLISELTFPHLVAAREEQLVAELERRRVVAERLAEHPASATSSERMPRSRRGAAARRRAGTGEPCPA